MSEYTPSDFSHLLSVYEGLLNAYVLGDTNVKTVYPNVVRVSASLYRVHYSPVSWHYPMVEFGLFQALSGASTAALKLFAKQLQQKSKESKLPLSEELVQSVVKVVEKIRLLSIIQKVYSGTYSNLVDLQIESSSGVSEYLLEIGLKGVPENAGDYKPVLDILRLILNKVKNKPPTATYHVSIMVLKLLTSEQNPDSPTGNQVKGGKGFKKGSLSITDKTHTPDFNYNNDESVEKSTKIVEKALNNTKWESDEEYEKSLLTKLIDAKNLKTPLHEGIDTSYIENAIVQSLPSGLIAMSKRMEREFALIRAAKNYRSYESGSIVDMPELIAERISPAGRMVFKDYGKRTGFHAHILIDMSSSMSKWIDHAKLIDIASMAAYTIYNACDNRWVIPHLYGFSGVKSLSIKRFDKLKIGRYRYPQLSATGGTPLCEGLEYVRREAVNTTGKHHIFVITDGYPNDNGEESALIAKRCRLDGVGLTGVHIGLSSADPKLSLIMSNIFGSSNWIHASPTSFDSKFIRIVLNEAKLYLKST